MHDPDCGDSQGDAEKTHTDRPLSPLDPNFPDAGKLEMERVGLSLFPLPQWVGGPTKNERA